MLYYVLRQLSKEVVAEIQILNSGRVREQPVRQRGQTIPTKSNRFQSQHSAESALQHMCQAVVGEVDQVKVAHLDKTDVENRAQHIVGEVKGQCGC